MKPQLLFAGSALAIVSMVATSAAFAADATSNAPSPTLGARPMKNAVVLFDGTNQDAWVSQMNRQWEKTDGPPDWKITPEGYLEVVPGAGSLISKQRFGDFLLHFEFRLPPGDVNGGAFLMTRYELGISASSDGDSRCGGFDNLKQKVRPSAKVDLGPDEWQSFDVDFRAPRFDAEGKVTEPARATVRFNGVTIHDNVELGPRKGAAKRLGDAPQGFLMLQEHGAKHWFRNIWIVDRAAAVN